MVFAAFLLAVTGVIRGVERFGGPLWAAKSGNPGFCTVSRTYLKFLVSVLPLCN